ncbi:MAG: DNA mismatch repair protein MutS, partial [Firmicutes bacterium]|nr:DNA mismatch repair protein MutS [Bacillota bacterium]
PMCGVPYHAADGYIARLIAAGQRVAICEQTEDPRAAKGLVKRDIVRILSPGTAFDHVAQGQRPLVGAVSGGEGGTCEAAVVDPLSGAAWVIGGDWHTVWDWLETRGVRELVAPDDGADCSALRAQCAARAIAYTPFAHGGGSPYALVRAYLDHGGRRALIHLQEPTRVASDVLVVSPRTLAHLEVFAAQNPDRAERTLMTVVDFTSTPMGERTLRDQLAEPLADVHQIAERQDAIAVLLQEPLVHRNLIANLKDMRDVERICSRVSYGTDQPRDLVVLAAAIRQAQEVSSTLASLANVSLWQRCAQAMPDLSHLADEIAHTLVDDPKLGAHVVRDGVDPAIDRLRGVAAGGRDELARLEAGERARTGIRNLKVGYNRVFGYYIEVTSAHAASVPQDYERKQTLAGTERYTTRALRALESEIASAQDTLVGLEDAVWQKLRARTRDVLPDVQRMAAAIGLADALQSLAQAARAHGYVRPQVDASDVLSIVDGRHPVVEMYTDAFVANDLVLDSTRRLLLITGPNMGGKSTYMRQVALIVLLAQIGSFVPAKKAHIGVVDRIFTRIGASDDVAGGESTFMVEMTETADILAHATARSLVLFDEIGRGTATYDGLSIAGAVVEHVHDVVGARTLFATHYHELTELADALPHASNISVAVREQRERVVFLHRIIDGPADRSYGIEVARLAGLPVAVVRRAQALLESLEQMPKGAGEIAAGAQSKRGLPSWEQQLVAQLARVDVDDLSPRGAHALLAEFVTRAQQGGDVEDA